jgi:hypothetical protein
MQLRARGDQYAFDGGSLGPGTGLLVVQPLLLGARGRAAVFQHPHRGWGEQDSDDRDHGIAGVGAWSTSRRPRTTAAMKNTTESPTARPATSSGEPCWAAAATATNAHPHSSVVIPPASTTWANSRRVWPRSSTSKPATSSAPSQEMPESARPGSPRHQLTDDLRLPQPPREFTQQPGQQDHHG